jgi:hypothetical protein
LILFFLVFVTEKLMYFSQMILNIALQPWRK